VNIKNRASGSNGHAPHQGVDALLVDGVAQGVAYGAKGTSFGAGTQLHQFVMKVFVLGMPYLGMAAVRSQ
jgi:hypothetical protein